MILHDAVSYIEYMRQALNALTGECYYMCGNIDLNFGTTYQAQLKNIFEHWIECKGKNIFGISGDNVFKKLAQFRSKLNSDRNTGSRNKFLWPPPDQRHEGFPMNEWIENMYATMDEMNVIEEVPAGTSIEECEFRPCCEHHKANSEQQKELAEQYEWHADFQADARYDYSPSDVKHYVCGAFATADHHKGQKKPNRQLFLCNDKSTMKRHLIWSTPHGVDISYSRAMMLSSI